MTSLPKGGTLTVRARESSAPTADDLLGRGHIPAIASALANVGATVRGFVESPLDPLTGRARLLAQWDRGLDVDVAGGWKLRALDAVDGRFNIHLTPPIGSKDYSLHISFGETGQAIVRTHPHAPDAPIGFYNLGTARDALGEVRRILAAAAVDPDTSRTNVLRAERVIGEIDGALGHVDRMSEALASRPKLALLETAAALAYKTKKAGDASDVKLSAALAEIRAYVEAGADGLAKDLGKQIDQDLHTISADRDKWVNWHASTGVFTFYVPR